jgi:uncharacterized protein (DUF924 family)
VSGEISRVLAWWFGDKPPASAEELRERAMRWFRGGEALDPEVREKFGALVDQALDGGLTDWEATTDGTVALIIVLDQLTRHAYRNHARMYDGDARAQRLSVGLFDSGVARSLNIHQRHFAMMPMVHAEDVALQRRAVEEMDLIVAEAPPFLAPFFAMGIEQTRKYLDVITRFGRFPHRNMILGRTSTPEEVTFMETFVREPKGA